MSEWKSTTGINHLKTYKLGGKVEKQILNEDLEPYIMKGTIRMLERLDDTENVGNSYIRVYLDHNRYFVEPLHKRENKKVLFLGDDDKAVQKLDRLRDRFEEAFNDLCGVQLVPHQWRNMQLMCPNIH